MKKKFEPVVPQSAREAVPSVGTGMHLDDFAVSNPRVDHLEESLAPTIAELKPVIPTTPSPHNAPTRTTKMIATPIEAGLRKMLRELRNEYEVSEAFTIETALRAYFGDRPLAEIAAELRERGGRLRRSKS